jgi:DNA-binding transcriptional LysR family regulator
MDLIMQMRIFRQVVESRSLTGAARALSITLPVVSRELARLERRVAQPLLMRTTRSLSLTEAGQRYYDKALRILDDVDELDRAMLDLSGEPAGELRISVSEVLGYLKVTPLLAAFQQQYPKVRLSVHYSDRNVDLVAERYDLAIRMGPLQDSTLLATRLFDSRGVVCAAPSYLEQHGLPRCVDELASHRLIGFADGAATLPWFIREQGRLRTVPVASAVRVDQALSYVALATAGCGIALLFDWMIEAELEAGTLAPLLEGCVAGYSPEGAPTVFLVRPHSRFEARAARALADFLRDRLAA